MQTRTTLALVAAIAVAWPLLVVAGPGDRQGDQPQRYGSAEPMQMPTDFQPELVSARRLLGATVHDASDQKAGELTELVLDPHRNGLAYAVIDRDGERIAVPWSAFQVKTGDQETGDDAERPTVALRHPRSRLEQAERLDQDLAHAADPRWIQSVSVAYYGDRSDQASGESGKTRGADWKQDEKDWDPEARERQLRSRRLTDLTGRQASNPQHDDLGQVRDILVDTNRGHLAYAIVDVRDGLWDGQPDQVAVPWHATQVREQTLFVDSLRSQLEDFAHEGDRRVLEQRAHAMQLHRKAQLEPYWLLTVWTPMNEPRPAHAMMGEEQHHGGAAQPARQTRYGSRSEAMARRTMTVTGEIERIMRDQDGVRLEMTTIEGRTCVVDAGRREQLASLSLAEGDHVTVMGEMSRAGEGEGAKDHLTAQVIATGEMVQIDRSSSPKKQKSAEKENKGRY